MKRHKCDRWNFRDACRCISEDCGDSIHLIARSINRLRKARKAESLVLAITGHHMPILRRLTDKTPKLRLWGMVGMISYGKAHRQADTGGKPAGEILCKTVRFESVASELKKTFAYKEEQSRLYTSSWYNRGRITEPRLTAETVKRAKTDKLLFWHHYDSRGYVSKLWLDLLLHMQQKGWLVVVSSSKIAKEGRERLEDNGVYIQNRVNIGRCLGAYKDFAMLMREAQLTGTKAPITTIYCNDSTIPIGDKSSIEKILEGWHQENIGHDGMNLKGMTDSIQLGTYHLQTYMIGASRMLASSDTWYRFWERLELSTDKEMLIRSGELGLSRDLLKEGVRLSAEYSLIDLALNAEGFGKELSEVNISDLRLVNPTLFAWRTLLRKGYPFIKKQLVFETCLDREPEEIALGLIGGNISESMRSELRSDLEQIVQGRFS